MDCIELRKLEMEHKIAVGNVMLFRSENKTNHGQTKRTADQRRKQAQADVFELAEKIALHKSICPDCTNDKG
jgi:hypothetical protein